jgi:predicted nucleotidyltransferase
MATKQIVLIIETRTIVVEAKASPEKDKFGQMGVLTWLTNQNVRDLKETVNKYIQDAPEKDDSLIKRLVFVNYQLHNIWTELNPS